MLLALDEVLDRLAAAMRAVTAAVCRATIPAANSSPEADTEADRAMTWLKQAVAAGYKDSAQLARDTDLDALRGREDFQKLLADLKQTKAPARHQMNLIFVANTSTGLAAIHCVRPISSQTPKFSPIKIRKGIFPVFSIECP
jgi:hypothetical protein